MREVRNTETIPVVDVTFDDEGNATVTPTGETADIVTIELFADDGKVLISKLTGHAPTEHVTLGTFDSTQNYEEVDAI